MRQLRLIGVDDDGHLLLTENGDDRLALPIDDALRAALRPNRTRPSADVGSVPVAGELRPRDVQAMLRGGVSVEDVADRAGWSAEKVLRYEGPIRAERDHVAGVARAIPVSGEASGRADSTFGQRVERRLDGRGVAADDIVWDAWRSHDGQWTVICGFHAGGRARQASWHFEVRTRALEPTDDEARWLGEDENSPGLLTASSTREASVYDVEAEGGLNGKRTPAVRKVRGGRTSATAMPAQPGNVPEVATEPGERPVDLVAAMRERSKNRKRKGRGSAAQDFPADAAPQEQLDTTGVAPPVGSHPREDELVGEPAGKPSVDDLGHDPVTGTADLFADLEPSALDSGPHDEAPRDDDEQSVETSEESDAIATDSSAPRPADAESAASAGQPDSEPESAEPDDQQDDLDANDLDALDEQDDLDGSDEPDDLDAVDEQRDPPEADESRAPVSAAEPEPEADEASPAVPDRPSTARKGRPSVPSWDDIMFGRRPGGN